MNKNHIVIIGSGLIIAAVALASLLFFSTSPAEDPVSIIVKGKDLAAARAAVVSVGGEITHELGIIRSVGANVTSAQIEALRGLADIKISANRSIGTTGACTVTGAGYLRFDGSKVMWDLANQGASSVTISKIELSWPAASNKLKKIKLDGSEIYNVATNPTSAVIQTGWRGNVGDRMIDPADAVEFKLEFESNAPVDPSQFAIRVTFVEGCTVEFSAAPACFVVGGSGLAYDGNKLLWSMANNGSETATISRVEISWPTAASTLKKLKLDGSEFYNIETAPPSMVATAGWKGNLDDRSLAPGDDFEFKVEFDNDAVTDPNLYAIEVGFAGGCSAVFGAPPPAPTPTPTPTPPPPDPTPTPPPLVDPPDGSGTTVPSGLTRNVIDRFDGYSYRTNEGTDVGLGGWQEHNDDGAANDGNVYAVGNDGSVRL
ncbi:MAG: hypothetical protein QNL88_04280, partial [Acidobacteriota bacterium]|nr:hypothetical protein [Acidobacteriota bacterium]